MASMQVITSFLICSCLFISALSDVPAPIIKSLHIDTDIKYTYAKTLVTSRVLNPANISQEVQFNVVLPEEAFITGFVMTIKGKPYEAYIKEKEEAKKDYDTAVSAGQSAGHIFQTDSRYSKDFTVSVNVEAEEKVNFNLTYEELLSRKNKTYKNEININPQQIVPDISIVVNIEDLLKIKNVQVPQFSMSNELDQSETDNPNVKKEMIAPNKVRVEWSPSEKDQKELNTEGLNGKMVVKYDVDASNHSQQILVDQDGYFVHILRNDDLPVLNKHVIFVLDVSGSMAGTKIEQLKQAMEKIFSDLSENDYFSIVFFSVQLVPWKTDGVELEVLNRYDDGLEPINVPVKDYYIVPANKSNVDLALKFIKTLSTYGGTNINGGLRVGIDIARLGQKNFANSASPVEPMIIFLTDGEPNSEEADPDKIIDNVNKRNTGKVTIFSLGFGFDADMNFLKKLSIANNGFARRIYVDSDAALQLNNFYKEVASPVLSDIKFEYLPDQVQNTTAETKNLFSGSEILILGKVKPNSTVSGALSAITSSGRKTFPFPIDTVILPPKERNQTFGLLEKMWAYKTIKTLLDQNTVSKNDTIKNKAKDLALKYKFVTPLTSLVVVKPNISSVVDDQLDGSRPQHFALHGGSRRLAFKKSFSVKSGLSGAPLYASMSHQPPMARGFAATAGSFASPGSPAGSFALAGSPETGAVDNLVAPAYVQNNVLISAPKPQPSQHSTTTFSLEMTTESEIKVMEESTQFTKIPYSNVTWLNQTLSEDGLFLQPPSEVDENDVIALNITDVSTTKCLDGNDCRHFIFCTLDIFANDSKAYLPFKCHIDPKYLGVCCPV